MMKRKFLFLVFAAIALVFGTSSKPITFFYENDVHCSVDGYAKMAYLKKQSLKDNPNVRVVSSGDYVQGGGLGALSKGEYIVNVMNAVGYDAVTLGNHEFDYGIPRLKELSGMLDADIVTCNLIDLNTGTRMFAPYKMMKFDDVRIAVVGISTPYSFVSARPSYFQDAEGNMMYSLCAETFYDSIQAVIDQARGEGADYVIAIAHIGDDAFDEINSTEMAQRTRGLDVILDGHAHTVLPARYLKNSEGKEVLVTSTGSNFKYVGKLTLSDKGEFKSELIPAENIPSDPDVLAVINDVKSKYDLLTKRVIGSCEAELNVDDEDGPRQVRYKEMGIGDFCSDAVRGCMNTDVAFMNGGAIRAALHKGDITYDDILTVFPFDNTVATASMTGQQILDMLEFSVYVLPVEFGGFLQVAGLRFDVVMKNDTPVTVDVNKNFSGFLDCPRRVQNVMVEAADGTYSPIDPGKTYSTSALSFLLKEHGDGYGVLDGVAATDTGMIDVDMLESFIVEYLKGVIPAKYGEAEGRINLIY